MFASELVILSSAWAQQRTERVSEEWFIWPTLEVYSTSHGLHSQPTVTAQMYLPAQQVIAFREMNWNPDARGAADHLYTLYSPKPPVHSKCELF